MKRKRFSLGIYLILFFALVTLRCETNETGAFFIPNASYSDSISNTDLKVLTVTSHEATTGAVDSVELAPAFNTKIGSYNAAISSLTTNITIVAVASDERSIVQINSQECNSRTMDIPENNREIAVVVTAPDTVTTRTYTVIITRTWELDEYRLLNLVVSSEDDDIYTLSPVFNPDMMNYKLRVGATDDYVIIKPTAINKTASIKVNDAKVASGTEKVVIITIAKGNSTATQSIPITVTTSSGAIGAYTLEISRNAAAATTRDEAHLQYIRVAMGNNGSMRQIYQDADGNFFPDNSDGFNKEVYGYSCVVFGFKTVSITAKALSSNVSAMTINGVSGALSGGKLSVEVDLAEDVVTAIPVHVVAENGTTALDYTLRVRLLNIYEMFYGIYGPVARANKESWGAAGTPNWSKTFSGSVSGSMAWNITWVTTLSTVRNQMTYTDYNNGDRGMPFVGGNGGFKLNGDMSVIVNTSGTGTGPQTGTITMQTPEGDAVAIFQVHYRIVSKNAASRDATSYTTVDYMDHTGVVLYYDGAPDLKNLGADYWNPGTPWTAESFWHP